MTFSLEELAAQIELLNLEIDTLKRRIAALEGTKKDEPSELEKQKNDVKAWIIASVNVPLLLNSLSAFRVQKEDKSTSSHMGSKVRATYKVSRKSDLAPTCFMCQTPNFS